MSVFSERLSTVRKSLNINKSEAARRLHMSAMGYGRYESGERMPSYQTICYIAQVFGTTAEYLTGSSDISRDDVIRVSSDQNPDLYQITQTLMQSDDAELTKRIRAYLDQLLKESL